MKYLIVVAFVGIIGALSAAGVFMLRGGQPEQQKSGRMMRALAWRVALSILLFGVILLSYWLGWIQPSGIPAGR